jgi:NAD(P)H-hydrate repair Nnr-like enzyme with NAD(P)H-hydrate dehydratase domain
MNQSYWHKQGEKALFPNLLWARPEVKGAAGKLLVVGGHAQSFAAAAEAYTAAEKAGIGTVRVLLPDSLEKTVGKLFPSAEFAPSNPSGGFATRALAELLAAAQWADGVLLAGDLGRNSESLAMLENFAGKYTDHDTIDGWDEAREEAAALGIDHGILCHHNLFALTLFIDAN